MTLSVSLSLVTRHNNISRYDLRTNTYAHIQTHTMYMHTYIYTHTHVHTPLNNTPYTALYVRGNFTHFDLQGFTLKPLVDYQKSDKIDNIKTT